MGINELNRILGHVYGEWKFIEQHGWQIEIYSTMILAIEDLWGHTIGLPNDGYVVVKVMCLKTLCVDGNGKK